MAMRILMTTRGSAGHVLPLVPIARAALRAGHEVLVATQPAHRANIEAAGLTAAPLADPPPEAWMPLLADYARQDLRTASERMIGEDFGRVDVEAALPGLRALADRWRPDVVVRDSWEFAGTIVAEERGLPLVRVALGLAEVEELTVRTVAPALAEHRAAAGLPSDPGAARLRATRYLTAIPAELEDPATPAPSATQRFRGVEASA